MKNNHNNMKQELLIVDIKEGTVEWDKHRNLKISKEDKLGHNLNK